VLVIRKRFSAIAIAVSALLLFCSCEQNRNSSTSGAEQTLDSISESPKASMTTPSTSGTMVTPEAPKAFLKESSIPDVCKSRYGYYQLNADEKAVYDELVNAAKHFEQSVNLSRNVTKEQIQRICNILYIEENDLYYLTDEYELSRTEDTVKTIYLTYSYNSDTVNRINAEVDKKLNEILNMITPQMSTVDKIKLFHDRIIYGCVYTMTGEFIASPYGAMVKGEAVCEGYARAFAMLCNKAGIENLFACGTVTGGESSGDQHMWNMVKIDGAWYNIDLTADDPNAEPGKAFLGYDYILYNYFLFPTSQLSYSRENIDIDESLYTLPQATSMNANYFVYYGYYANTCEEGIKILTKAMDTAVKSKKKYIRLRFSNIEEYDKTVAKLFEEKEIFTLEAQFELPRVNLWRSRELQLFQLELIYGDD